MEVQSMNVHDLIVNPPRLHEHNRKLISDWRLADDELLLLDRQLTEGMKTIETGAGVSTVVFAIKGTKHTCVVPVGEEVDRIKAYCDEHSISHTNINFVIDRLEYVLPQLGDKDFDLALIDGRHGFPAPFIDWFYIAGLLKTGGVVLIDDLHIWTCELLKQFLLSEEEWTLIAETTRAATFMKLGDRAQHKEWGNQAFVWSRSRAASPSVKARYLLNLLRRGELSLFRRAVGPQLTELGLQLRGLWGARLARVLGRGGRG